MRVKSLAQESSATKTKPEQLDSKSNILIVTWRSLHQLHFLDKAILTKDLKTFLTGLNSSAN